MRVEHVQIAGADGTLRSFYEKRLSPRERELPEAQARLRGEAALLRALEGRVTPRVIEEGEDARGPWLRTEPVPFPTLASRLEAGGAGGSHLDPSWLPRATRAAFEALAELHEARDDHGPLRVVHADLSPANVAVDDAAERVCFLDLELASWRESAPRDGAFRGTVVTCAPELARGEAPSAQADLFALAATLLHVTLGGPPRVGPSLAALLAVAAERPLLDERHVAALDLLARGGAHAALARCLAHDAAARPVTARHVAALLK